MAQELKAALIEFVRFAQTLRGDEKSEAQTFLDHFFRALGHAGVIEAGATFEFRVAKKPGSPQLELITGNGARPKGGKKFADLLWPDRVLIEMKSRGENLEKHYDQAFDYWTHIVPKRPPFVILCNFDEFWIYDFNTQLFDPVDRIKIAELPENISSLNFLLPIWKKPIFGNNWVDILQSGIHWSWFITTCSKLKGDFRYTPESVFDTFTWPQQPTRAQIKAVAETAVALRALRRETMRKLNYSLRQLYRTLEQPGDNPLRDAHARLDTAVRAVYGMADDADPLVFLLELNLACAAKEKAGKKITPPGLPLPAEEHVKFVTDDCIRPPKV